MPVIYLIPSLLHEEGINTIPGEVLKAVRDSKVIFAENERTSRRYLKKLDKNIVIDEFEWFNMEAGDEVVEKAFTAAIKANKNISIISEAGCPGIADPGQRLVHIAQEMDQQVKPLVGPSSILLALMASGMNGQYFRFNGYLPVDKHEREQAIKKLEMESLKTGCTEMFIETPYRNNQLLESILRSCRASTRLCVAVDLTANSEWIKTKPVSQWKKEVPELNKRPAIFLLYAG